MSWYADPQLFLLYMPNHPKFVMFRIRKEFGSHLQASDFGEMEELDFNKHFSLPDHKVSDFDVFINIYPKNPRIWKFINSQGVVVTFDDPNKVGTWSHEEPNSPIWSLAKRNSVPQKPALEETVKELQAMLSYLKDEVEKAK
ncbi:hypothetical protein MKX01_034138, partial [Papaver californicum]